MEGGGCEGVLRMGMGMGMGLGLGFECIFKIMERRRVWKGKGW